MLKGGGIKLKLKQTNRINKQTDISDQLEEKQFHFFGGVLLKMFLFCVFSIFLWLLKQSPVWYLLENHCCFLSFFLSLLKFFIRFCWFILFYLFTYIEFHLFKSFNALFKIQENVLRKKYCFLSCSFLFAFLSIFFFYVVYLFRT